LNPFEVLGHCQKDPQILALVRREFSFELGGWNFCESVNPVGDDHGNDERDERCWDHPQFRHCGGQDFDHDWSPPLIESYDYKPTESGQFFKNAMSRGQPK